LKRSSGDDPHKVAAAIQLVKARVVANRGRNSAWGDPPVYRKINRAGVERGPQPIQIHVEKVLT
jgi:hypothetical protein